MKHSISALLITIALTFSCKTEPNQYVTTHINAIENGLLKPIQVKGQAPETFNILDRMKHHNVPGASIAIVINGKIQWAKGYGIANTQNGQTVNNNTLFQAGSISKPIAALSALKLVEEGKLDLDENINTYLKGWKIPQSKFLKDEKVTLRRLLTHTSGMTVHGFPGYTQKDSFPSIETVLKGKGNTSAIFVDTIPGSIWRYSGGGYTVMEKVVEDVSELALEDYMFKNILTPMEMSNSVYDQPLLKSMQSNASAAYYGDGKIIEGLWHNYPEQAAAGLWTTPTDLAKYCIEIQNILTNNKEGVLSKAMVEQMLIKDKNDWGLGPSLRNEKDSLMFGHGGKNAGFTNDMLASAYHGNAIIVMTNADNGGKLIDEILRAASKHYDWKTHDTREVEIVEMNNEELTKFKGKYKLDFQVPDIGDYFINITVQDGKLHVMDPNNNDTNLLSPQKDSKFIDLDKGDSVVFNSDENNNIGLLWSGRFQFDKVEEK